MKNTLVLAILLVLLTSNGKAQSIFRTACQGNIARLDSLFADNTVQKVDSRGRSLLHWAVACEQKEVVDYLLGKGVPLNSEDQQQKTPMHVAVQFNSATFFDLLIQKQPDGAWIDNYGTSLLELAILNTSEPFVEKLLTIGVDVNGTNNRGSTPLEIAKRIHADTIYNQLLRLGGDEGQIRTFTMEGPYMGQEPPGKTPKLFAPNFISTEESEFGAVFSARGTELYYAVDVNGKYEIRRTQLVDSKWTTPEVFLSHEAYGYNDPFLSNDETRLYFISKRALDGAGPQKDVDIWYVERNADGWSAPINAGPNINSDRNEYYISFTKDETLYFSSNVNASEEEIRTDYDIYYAEFQDGAFLEPVALGNTINTEAYEADVFVAPDESYLIFCSTRDGGFGRGDLYISFRNTDGNWQPAVNMGPSINTKNYEYCPFVTKDGKYLMYTSNQDIYWVSTSILDSFKEQKE